MRVWFSGRTRPSQGLGTGPIPVTRSLLRQNMKYLSGLNKKQIGGKSCLLRLDLNIQNNEIKNSIRIKRAVSTIKFLIKNNCKVVIVSHRGRPAKFKAGKEETLKPLVIELKKLIGKEIKFKDGFNFEKIKSEIAKSSPRSIFMLENIRLNPGEEKNDSKLAKNLSILADFYVNDAFAVSHRKNASICAITKFLPSYAGLEMESEVKAFEKVMEKLKKPLVLILGGAKVSDKIGVIKYFYDKADKILVGGGVANTFFFYKNIPIGSSLYENNPLLKSIVAKYSKKVQTPLDVVIENKKILDIKEETVKNYGAIIKKAGTIIWNGPMGFIEDKKFQSGTLSLVKQVAKSRAFSLVGGGETTSFVIAAGKEKSFSFLSTGGGAMLEYLSGKKLPGIECLK